MDIRVIAVGSLKETYWRGACAEYLKRLQAYAKVEVVELADEKAPERLSEAQRQQVMRKEGERILSRIREREVVAALCIDGRAYTSEAFATWLGEVEQGGNPLVLVIGGSLGLHECVFKRAQFRLSFSAMTFPHQLCRVILLEQVYRGYRILRNQPYHK